MSFITNREPILTHMKFREFLVCPCYFTPIYVGSTPKTNSSHKEIPIFLKEELKPRNTELENQIVDAQLLTQLALLADLMSHFNEIYFNLIGTQKNPANLFGHVDGSKNKTKPFNSSLDKNDSFIFSKF